MRLSVLALALLLAAAAIHAAPSDLDNDLGKTTDDVDSDELSQLLDEDDDAVDDDDDEDELQDLDFDDDEDDDADDDELDMEDDGDDDEDDDDLALADSDTDDADEDTIDMANSKDQNKFRSIRTRVSNTVLQHLLKMRCNRYYRLFYGEYGSFSRYRSYIRRCMKYRYYRG